MSVYSGPRVEPVDTRLLRQAFGAFATGVTVVTVGGDTPHGMTANSFASVSLDPPLLLVCVDRTAITHSLLLDAPGFGVSVLSAAQERVARHFADRRRPHGAAQFDVVDWRPGAHTGAPLLEGAIARFECRSWDSYPAGDHSVFLGELLSMETSGLPVPEDPLLFFRGRLLQAGAERSERTA